MTSKMQLQVGRFKNQKSMFCRADLNRIKCFLGLNMCTFRIYLAIKTVKDEFKISCLPL